MELQPVDREFEGWAETYPQLRKNYKDMLKELSK